MEDAVAAVGAVGQRLGVVLEGVRRRLGPFVIDLEQAARGGLGRVALELIEHEVHVGPVLFDGTGHNKALDAQMAVVGLVAHAAQLGNGDVVALAGSVTGPGQPDDGADDHGGRDADAHGAGGGFHRPP